MIARYADNRTAMRISDNARQGSDDNEWDFFRLSAKSIRSVCCTGFASSTLGSVLDRDVNLLCFSVECIACPRT